MDSYLIGRLIVQLLVIAGLALIPANLAKQKGYSFGWWWLYGFLVFVIALIHVCCIPNKNVQQTPANDDQTPYSPPSKESVAGELKKYKDLLDSGVITQEEFDAKKKQFLGL